MANDSARPSGGVRKFRKYKAKLWRRWMFLRLALVNRFSSRSVVAGNMLTVSLTSYSTRLKSVHITLESIAAGNVLPGRLILWVDDLAVLQNLPAPLRRLQRRGLEIKRCDNYGPHKKYFPFVQGEEINEPLVTADDDVFYPATWLQGLQLAHLKTPTQVVCYKAKCLGLVDGAITSYRSWVSQLGSEASFSNFAIGVSGVLYPPAYLRVLKVLGDGFVQLTPKADDIWLHLNALRSGFKVRQISSCDAHFPSLPGTQDIALYAENLKMGGNDQVIARLYTADDIAKMLKG